MAVALLEEWCKVMGADVQKSLLATGIPVDCGDPEIRTVLQEVLKCVGSYQLLSNTSVATSYSRDSSEARRHQCWLTRTYGGHRYVCGPQRDAGKGRCLESDLQDP
ncbi:Paraneoplastic antigen Ma2 homolog [Apodemus speciosus]|uniref:Paraneoplastic antigen Ma2 homolog n=1 Tax=Apodemus speciosus TaxID=105296 RepID=A0ABQ0FIH4_APOSI